METTCSVMPYPFTAWGRIGFALLYAPSTGREAWLIDFTEYSLPDCIFFLAYQKNIWVSLKNKSVNWTPNWTCSISWSWLKFYIILFEEVKTTQTQAVNVSGNVKERRKKYSTAWFHIPRLKIVLILLNAELILLLKWWRSQTCYIALSYTESIIRYTDSIHIKRKTVQT